MLDNAFRHMLRDELRAVLAEMLPKAQSITSSERLTVQEAAAFAKVSEATVRNWLKAGELQTYRAGRQQRVDRQDLESFMRLGPTREKHSASPEELAARRFETKARA